MRSGLFLAFVLAAASVARAGDWPQWRGPFHNGSTDETDLPTKFSTTENVAWTADLPSAAASTPVIFGQKVFLSGCTAKDNTLQAMCFDRLSGKKLWEHDVAEGIRKDFRNTFASPSPVTNGKIVVFFYGNGELACFDVDGKELWARNIQRDYGGFAFLWTFSSSPTLFEGKLYLPVLQRDVPVQGRGRGMNIESFILAMDPETGKTLFKHVRPSKARMESRESFTTMTPYEYEGTKQLLLAGGDALSAHDPATGKELWRWGTWNPSRITHWRLVPSPVAGDGVILACAPKRDPIYAIKAGGSGVLDDDMIAWVSDEVREVSSDVPTPALYDGDFFVLSDVRMCISRVEPRTGKVKWTVATPGRTKYEASPLAADGKLYLVNFAGEVTVMDATDGKVLNTIPMDDPVAPEVVRSSVVAAYGQLYIRTTRKLYCIGQSRP